MASGGGDAVRVDAGDGDGGDGDGDAGLLDPFLVIVLSEGMMVARVRKNAGIRMRI
jgi:hypothetical protein